MKIAIPLLSAAPHISGVQRHAINLAHSLISCPKITHVHLITGAWQTYAADAVHPSPRITTVMAPCQNTIRGRNQWFYFDLPRLAQSLDVDLVHLAYPVAIRRSAFEVPVVTTLHDLYPCDAPENFGRFKAFFNRLLLRQCLRQTDAVACVSSSTMARLDAHFPSISLQKASVIPNSVEFTEPARIPAYAASIEPFLLCVAQHRHNKNLLLLLEAYLRLRARIPEMRLVIIGTPGPETSRIKRFLQQENLLDEVLLYAGISDGELRWFYENCATLVALSSTEGFGLPVAEGLLLGARIICTDIPAFREVGSKTCRYVAPSATPQTIANAIIDELKCPKPQPQPLPALSSGHIGALCAALYSRLIRHHRKSGSAIPTEEPMYERP